VGDKRKRLSRDGLPVDGRDWTTADWQDLHEAVERAKRTIAARHRRMSDAQASDATDNPDGDGV
jgi:hypothetical protein